jgi:DeoR/GlpR family transcriptional regulator of sugar metabolism
MTSMYPFERKEKILDRLRKIGRIHINEDAKLFNASISTLHRDLEDLEKQGLVKKVVGGAVLLNGIQSETHFDKRLQNQAKEKKAIARNAVQHIQDDTSIFLDHSSTTTYLAREIKQRSYKSLLVLTNSLQIPVELGGIQGIQVISTGGAVESEFKALHGRWVVDSIQRINLNQIFISVGAISVDNGLMTQMHFINDLFPELFRRSQHINVLVDSSKFYKLCTFQISPLKPSFTIFTDKALPEEIRHEIEAKGLKLMI